MKLLLDENLSRRLVPFLQAEFPETTQVALAGLERANDLAIWEHARDCGYVIVTRDADFEELSTIHGCPPRVIWIRGENMSKAATLNLLLANRAVIEDALGDDGVACVEIGLNIERGEDQQTPDSYQRGFTLVELAIVMFIVALLLGGMLLPLSAQQDIRARYETEKALSDIRDALIGFAITNGRLPRPANSAANGAEAAACANDAACSGFVPWAALGTAKLDGWGKLIRYSVTPTFANATITLSTVANRTVQTRDATGALAYLVGGASCTTPNQCAPAVIFSQGKSRWGTTEAGVALPDGSTTNIDEDANENGPTNYISRTPSDNTNPVYGGEFDDITVWLSGNTLFNRMVAAGKLP
jgi:prepilin-type N-terminal cleavage/methylation domain-containing protein